MSTAGKVWIALFRGITWIPFHTLWRIKVSGMENIPAEGSLIIASNHVTALDSVFIEFKLYNRRINWMAKAELFDNKLFGAFLRSLDAFPVKRGKADVTAANEFTERLKEGKTLGIFPQGTRCKDFSNPKPAHSGFIRFALESGAPILPVAVYGKFKIFGTIYVKYLPVVRLAPKPDGKPYNKAEMLKMGQDILDGIYASMPEDQRGNH